MPNERFILARKMQLKVEKKKKMENLLDSARCKWYVASSSSANGARLLSKPDPMRYKSKLSLP